MSDKDTIYRQNAIDAVCMEWCGVKHQDCKHPFDVEKDDCYWCDGCKTALRTLPDLPPAQPEITDERAIEHLQSTGWMQNHDREMYESGLREQLADDSGSYDSLIPCEDTISRQAAIDAVNNAFDRETLLMGFVRSIAVRAIRDMPSAEPEKVCIARINLSEEQVREAFERAKNETVQVLPPAQKKGHWIDEETNYLCSECHRGCWVNSDYCPWCGAKMKR